MSDPFMAAIPVLVASGINVVTIEQLLAADPVDPVETDEDDVALLQLTSGSTGSPKAVQITHRNLVSNAEAMFVGAEFDMDSDVIVSWLPLFHDMGMTGFLTVPMYFGAELVKITPMDFLQDILLWARLIDKYKGTMTAAPNFAYALFGETAAQAGATGRVRPVIAAVGAVGRRAGRARRRRGPDRGRSAVRPAAGGDPAGIRHGGKHCRRVIFEVRRRLAGRRGRCRPAGDTAAGGAVPPTATPCGSPRSARCWQACRRAWSTSSGPWCGQRSVGVIEVRGEPVTRGYITKSGIIPTQDEDGWYDTGDLGYLTEDDHVVVCGRVKDVIIMAGRNVYPTDIERAAGRVVGVRPGCAVAVRLDAGQSRESFAVAVESNAYQDSDEVSRIKHQVAHEVVADVDVRPRNVAVLGPGVIPKTPSGKLRRAHSLVLFA